MKEIVPSRSEPKPATVPSDRTKGEGSARYIRTYKEDVRDLIEKKRLTRTNIAIAEEERRRALGRSAVWEDKRTGHHTLLGISALALLLGLSMLFYEIAGRFFDSSATRSTDSYAFIVPGASAEIIGLDTLSFEELTRKIHATARNAKLEAGEGTRVAFRASTGTTSLPLPLSTYFRTLGSHPPDILTRSLAPKYEGGFINVGETKGYLVFMTTYYENAVVGLLSWEKHLGNELYPMIDPFRSEVVPFQLGGAWTTQTWGRYSVRALVLPDGRAQAVYGWVDRKTLIITGNVQAFVSIADRTAQDRK